MQIKTESNTITIYEFILHFVIGENDKISKHQKQLKCFIYDQQ